mmetsp:Transcript_5104/g.6670  ORF Transcript_5104/g.6670 Transcript_5104/m.6670 type:complete len:98 (-) Transcript_5104:120-413(-)
MVYHATILWQFQKGLWFDSFGKSFWNFVFNQEHNRDLDFTMVQRAYEEGWIIEDFEFRDQAELVQRYYISVTHNSGHNKTSFVALKHFALQILHDGI